MSRLSRTTVTLGTALLLGLAVAPAAYAHGGGDGGEMPGMDMTHQMPDGQQMSDTDMTHQMPDGEQMPGMDMTDHDVGTPGDHPTALLLGTFGAVNASVVVAAAVVRRRRTAKPRPSTAGVS